MNRRHLLFLMFGTLAAGPAAAQEAPAATPARPAPARPPRRPRRAAKPRPQEARKVEPPPPQPAPEGPQLEAAPVPNRDLEAPRVAEKDQTRLSPSIIHRRLPNQGMATEGAPSIQEERLFFPAPGARLNVPFSY